MAFETLIIRDQRFTNYCLRMKNIKKSVSNTEPMIETDKNKYAFILKWNSKELPKTEISFLNKKV